MVEGRAEGPPPVMSRLAAGQLLSWSDGEISAAKLQKMMADAVADGLHHPLVTRPSHVLPDQHAHSSLMELLKAQTPILDDICHVPQGLGDRVLKLSFIIQGLYQHYPTDFVRIMGAASGGCDPFGRSS